MKEIRTLLHGEKNERTKLLRDFADFCHGARIVFGERESLFEGLYGLTLAEMRILRSLLLRCFRSYLLKHPSGISQHFFLDSDENLVLNGAVYSSQSSKNGAQSTFTD